MVLKANELEIQHIQFGKLEDNSLVQSQKLAFISYKEPKARLVVQTPAFLTATYGIPREGPFYSTPKARAFFKLPFCHERHMHEGEVDYAQIEQFYEKLQEIDKYCDTDEFRTHMFGEKFAKKYEYQPLVRTAEEDPENPQGRDEDLLPPSLHQGQARSLSRHGEAKLQTFRQGLGAEAGGAPDKLQRCPAAHALHVQAPNGHTLLEAVRHEDLLRFGQAQVWHRAEGHRGGVRQ